MINHYTMSDFSKDHNYIKKMTKVTIKANFKRFAASKQLHKYLITKTWNRGGDTVFE